MSEVKDRSRSETFVANERVKALSGVFINLGTALLAAAVARVYVKGDMDGSAILRIICVVVLMFGGLKMLHLLDGEA